MMMMMMMMMMIASCRNYALHCSFPTHQGDKDQEKLEMTTHLHDQKKAMKITSIKVNMFI
jgi:hypothetical protein